MQHPAWQNRGWLKWSLIAIGWTCFAVFFSSEVILSRAYAGRPLRWGNTLAAWLICAYLWFALTPLAIFLARRFPIGRKGWPRNTLVHVGVSILFALFQLAAYVTLASWTFISAGQSFAEGFRNQFIGGFHFDLLTYWALLGVIEGLNYYRKYREREVRASQLEAQLARAQLDALKMQLHPHFLFNTLNTISVLMQEDVALANRLLLRLSDLLRLALRNTDAHEVSLREELEFLTSYLEIEQMRFQDRLTVRLDIDADAFEAQVPNLILQPLVENAIRYAVAPRATRSTVEIRAARNNGAIQLQVRDDGPGIGETQKATNGQGIGLRNTQDRLDKLYGPAHSFELSTAESGGLQVTITIPFSTANGSGEDLHGENPRANR